MWALLDDFIGLIFPRLCCACGQPLLRGEEYICLSCIVNIPRTNYHNLLDNPVEKLLWGRCKIERAATFSHFSRDSRMQQLIYNLKYNGIGDIGIAIGKLYGSELKRSNFLSGIDMIVPLPLHKRKERQRGYNQSELIAKGISLSTDIPSISTIIVKKRYNKSQTGKGRIDRWKNVEGVYMVPDYSAITNKHILLVDDVITTGATMEAAASELLKGEGVRVSVIALALTTSTL